MISAIMGIFGTIGGLVSNWQKKKLVEAEGKIRIAEAKVNGEIALQEKLAAGDISYDIEAQKGMADSWKDEWLTIVLSAVFIACFIPGLQEYVRQGFVFLKESTPWWFEWSFTGMIAASFGLRGWKLYKNGS